MITDQLHTGKRLALIAHDNKKEDLIAWAFQNKNSLTHHALSGTGSTATLLEEKTGLPVKKLLSGPLGGDQQVGALIAERKIDFLIFFWDPMEAQPHDSDVKALLRIAVAWNILIANNRTTADFLLASTLMNKEYTMEVPDYSKY
ncbi:MAG TPA: methylglyoxal synthase [Chitinophagaceae bacterium]|jgi:methylglyoxal synthase|nr:methylglyoxal synthase [Chitinophagaceae bacterium]